jgi:hypothetical protein
MAQDMVQRCAGSLSVVKLYQQSSVEGTIHDTKNKQHIKYTREQHRTIRNVASGIHAHYDASVHGSNRLRTTAGHARLRVRMHTR